jgi:hypothetical protein
VHLGHIEYIATDPTRTSIPWVQRQNPDGSQATYVASALKGAQPQGERRVMDCIDCHNRAAHTFVTAGEAINSAMADGAINPSLPWVHKEGLALLQAAYNSQDDAHAQIPQQLEAFYRTQHPEVLAANAALVQAAGQELVTLYDQNVLPLPRRRSRRQRRHEYYAGLLRLPQSARCRRGQAESARRSRYPD